MKLVPGNLVTVSRGRYKGETGELLDTQAVYFGCGSVPTSYYSREGHLRLATDTEKIDWLLAEVKFLRPKHPAPGGE